MHNRQQLLKTAAYVLYRAQMKKQAAGMSKALSRGLRGLINIFKSSKTPTPAPVKPGTKTPPPKAVPSPAQSADIPFNRLSEVDQNFGVLGYGLLGGIADQGIHSNRYINPREFHNSMLDLQGGLGAAYNQLPGASYFRSSAAPNFQRNLERMPADAMNLRTNLLGDRYENMARNRFLGNTGQSESARRAFDKEQNVLGREIEEYLDFMGRRGPKGEVLYSIDNPDAQGTNFFNMYNQLFTPKPTQPPK